MKLNTKPLADIELGLPVVAAGVYYLRIAKAEVKPNKQGDGNNLYIMCKILDNPVVQHKDGAEIQNRGQCIASRYISLKPTDDYDPDKALKELSVAIKNTPESDLNLEDLLNKVVKGKLSVQPARKDENTGKEYQESNSLDRFTPVADDDPFTPPPL